jgi:predicted ArsR family transcriptional regulator
MLPSEAAEAIAEEVGFEYGAALGGAMGGERAATGELPPHGAVPRSFRAALHAVADALTAHGFAAHAERSANGLRLVSDHCPFGSAAIDHPVLCAVDRGLVRGMLAALYGQADTATSSSLPMGDERCVTSVIA